MSIDTGIGLTAKVPALGAGDCRFESGIPDKLKNPAKSRFSGIMGQAKHKSTKHKNRIYMKTIRTRFAKDIVAEVAIPAGKSRRVIIFCGGGVPSSPGKKKIIEYFGKKGYWVVDFRYRGTWESEGVFLEDSPERDVLDIVDQLPKGFKDSQTGEVYQMAPSRLFLIGVSFFGPAAILASRDERVDKAVAVSSVVDWRFPSKAEPLDWLYSFIKEAFGRGYNVDKKRWNKLAGGKFYNPAYYVDEIDGGKLLLIHAKDDEVTPYEPVQDFVERVGAKLVAYKKGGHLSSSKLIKAPIMNRVWKFLRS